MHPDRPAVDAFACSRSSGAPPRSSASLQATRDHRHPSWNVSPRAPVWPRARHPLLSETFSCPRPARRTPPSGGNARGTPVELRHARVWASCLLITGPGPGPPPASRVSSSPSGAHEPDWPSSDPSRRDHRVAAAPGPPAVVRLPAHPQPSADIGHSRAPPDANVSLPTQAEDLPCTVPLLHRRTFSRPSRDTRIFSPDLDQHLVRWSLQSRRAHSAQPGNANVGRRFRVTRWTRRGSRAVTSSLQGGNGDLPSRPALPQCSGTRRARSGSGSDHDRCP